MNAGSFLTASDLIASRLLLAFAHCIPLSPQWVAPHRTSTHLLSRLLSFFSPHLISSHLKFFLPCSTLLSWSQLCSSPLMSPGLFSSFLSFFKLFRYVQNFSQLLSALRSLCQLTLWLLISSLLFSHLLTRLASPLLISAPVCLSARHLIAALLNAFSNHLSSSLAQNLLQTRTSVPKQATSTVSTAKI